MIKKTNILFMAFVLLLTGCFDSELDKRQQEHLKQYFLNLENVSLTHSKDTAASQDIEQLHHSHINTLENLKRLKDRFSQFSDEPRVLATSKLFDSALSNLLIREIQILELGQPLWATSLEKFNNIKNDDYYRHHQAMLSELDALLDEYNDLILEHHENVRKELTASTLSKEDREHIWPMLNSAIAQYLYLIKPSLKVVRVRVEAEIDIAQFLHEQRDHYTISEEQGLQFDEAPLLWEFQSKISSLERQLHHAKQ